MVISSNGYDTYVLYSYAGMQFQFGSPYIGYVANGLIKRQPDSLDGNFLRAADINLSVGGKLLQYIFSYTEL